MKNRKSALCIVAALVACSAVFSNAARKDETTLVMVPREEETIRLGTDIANKYQKTLLISYKLGANNAVSLHGWTGSDWVNVRLEAFQGGEFFKKGPDSALIVEKAGVAVPDTMVPPGDWCASVAKITTTEMRPLLHLVGQYYDFSFKEWKWFANRYSMDVDAINPEGLNVAWYQRRAGEHLKPREQQGASDLQYWMLLRQPVLAEPVLAVDAEAKKASPIPAVEQEEPGNPLTNAVPAAVVLGATDAEEGCLEAPAPETEGAIEEKGVETESATEDKASDATEEI